MFTTSYYKMKVYLISSRYPISNVSKNYTPKILYSHFNFNFNFFKPHEYNDDGMMRKSMDIHTYIHNKVEHNVMMLGQDRGGLGNGKTKRIKILILSQCPLFPHPPNWAALQKYSLEIIYKYNITIEVGICVCNIIQ